MSIVVVSIFNIELRSNSFSLEPGDFNSYKNLYSILGYLPIFNPNEPWTYRLTDTVDGCGTLMQHNQQLDLNKNWSFRFKLRFGSGKTTRTGDPGNGMALILATNPSNPEVRYTPHNNELPVPMFRIEYDTEFGHTATEGGGDSIRRQHTAFLKNDSYVALPNTFAEMQNNFAEVTNNQWIECRIDFQHLSNGKILLENYIAEQSTGEMILRNRMCFDAVTDLVADVVETDGKALVYWIFGAACCDLTVHNPNRHEIQYISLENSDDIDFTSYSGVPNLTLIYRKWCGTLLTPPPTPSTLSYGDFDTTKE